MITQNERDLLFFAFIPEIAVSDYTSSLAELSGFNEKLGPDDFQTSLTQAVEKAWETSICDLTCAQVRMLVGQKMGLEWIAEPVGQFIQNHPSADIDFYPGDLTLAALRAFDKIAAHSERAASLIRNADYSWIETELDFEPTLVGEALSLIAGLN